MDCSPQRPGEEGMCIGNRIENDGVLLLLISSCREEEKRAEEYSTPLRGSTSILFFNLLILIDQREK